MEYVTIIVAALALWAAVVSICMLVLEKKRNERFRKAMADHIRIECEAVADAAAAYTREELGKLRNEFQGAVDASEKKYEETLAKKLDQLQVDYSEAQNAANHVNDFARGLANIFDYDPLAAVRRERCAGKEGS